MTTLYEFGTEIMKIREAIDNITVKGRDNASYVVYAHDRCSALIKEINRITESQRQLQDGQNGAEKERENNGEPDTGMAE